MNFVFPKAFLYRSLPMTVDSEIVCEYDNNTFALVAVVHASLGVKFRQDVVPVFGGVAIFPDE
jgi:hypothetical protein